MNLLRIRSIASVAVAFACLLSTARAAVLIHEYALRGTLNDNLGGPALVPLGGQISSLGYIFAANQGLALDSRVFDGLNFSLELSLQLQSTTGYTKIVDFRHLVSDTGLYQRDGRLAFYPTATAATADIAPNTTVQVVLTRDGATGLVSGYLDGQQRFSFVDTALLTTAPGPDNPLFFFVDDIITAQREASSGRLNYLRVFNGALSAGDVSALYAGGPPLSIPEPSAAALLIAGAGVIFFARRRFNRSQPEINRSSSDRP